MAIVLRKNSVTHSEQSLSHFSSVVFCCTLTTVYRDTQELKKETPKMPPPEHQGGKKGFTRQRVRRRH